jgi:hypothetical protein
LSIGEILPSPAIDSHPRERDKLVGGERAVHEGRNECAKSMRNLKRGASPQISLFQHTVDSPGNEGARIYGQPIWSAAPSFKIWLQSQLTRRNVWKANLRAFSHLSFSMFRSPKPAG